MWVFYVLFLQRLGFLEAGAPESGHLQIIFIKLSIKTFVVSPLAAGLFLPLLMVVCGPFVCEVLEINVFE